MKLYLAGPEVFLPDAAQVGKIKRELCRYYGFVGLFPLDNEINAPTGGPVSRAIFGGNIAMLDDADAVIANLTPFRGVSADAGTVFEIGYAFARGKKVFGYSNVSTPLIERVRRVLGGPIERRADGRLYAADGLAIEEFDRFDNLMIAESLLASGADIVTPGADPADRWHDMGAFEQTLLVIKARVLGSARLAAAR